MNMFNFITSIVVRYYPVKDVHGKRHWYTLRQLITEFEKSQDHAFANDGLIETLTIRLNDLEDSRRCRDEEWKRRDLEDRLEFKLRLTIEAFKRYESSTLGKSDQQCAREIMGIVNNIISEMNVGNESPSSKSAETVPTCSKWIPVNVNGE
jgi:hypothetical protein